MIYCCIPGILLPKHAQAFVVVCCVSLFCQVSSLHAGRAPSPLPRWSLLVFFFLPVFVGFGFRSLAVAASSLSQTGKGGRRGGKAPETAEAAAASRGRGSGSGGGDWVSSNSNNSSSSSTRKDKKSNPNRAWPYATRARHCHHQQQQQQKQQGERGRGGRRRRGA